MFETSGRALASNQQSRLRCPAGHPNPQLQTGNSLLSVAATIMLNLRKALFAVLLAASALLGLSGCFSSQQDSSIPWSRPADWENQIPGMGK